VEECEWNLLEAPAAYIDVVEMDHGNREMVKIMLFEWAKMKRPNMPFLRLGPGFITLPSQFQ
jgi:hypothetical protein